MACRSPNVRHLTERQVFVEAFGRQAFDRARQQRDERAAGRIGPPDAAVEIRGHAGARAGVLEKPEVMLRRPQEDRHLVERDAPFGLVEHPPRDLDRFAPFARRREQANVTRRLADRRPILREDVTAEVGEIARRGRGVGQLVERAAQAGERIGRRHVAIGDRRQHLRRAAGDRRDKFPLRFRVERHVQRR